MPLDARICENAINLMQRLDLKGQEVPLFVEVLNALQEHRMQCIATERRAIAQEAMKDVKDKGDPRQE